MKSSCSLLRRHEVVVLLVAKRGGFVEVGLAGRDGRRELVDRARERHDRGLRVLDGGLEVADGTLRARDGVLLRVRFLIAPRRVLLHKFLLVCQVALDLALQLIQELDDLLYRRDRQGPDQDKMEKSRPREWKLRVFSLPF